MYFRHMWKIAVQNRISHNSSSITAQKSWLELYKITRKSQVSSVKLLPGTVCVSGFPVHLHKHHFHQFISHVAVTTPGQNHVWRTRISASPLPGSPAPWVPDVLLGSFLDSCHWVRKKLEVQCLLHRGGAGPCLGRWSKDCLVLLVWLYVSYINILWAESYPVCVESLGDGCGHLSSFCLNLFDRPALFHLVRGYQWGFLVLFSFFYFFLSYRWHAALSSLAAFVSLLVKGVLIFSPDKRSIFNIC